MIFVSNILIYLVFSYLIFSVFYLGVLAFAGLNPGKKKYDNQSKTLFNKIAILIPAYKEDDVILETCREILKNSYPSFETFIIADGFKTETLQLLKNLKVHVISVNFEKSTKVKSLNKAFEEIQQNFDIALICDADNIFTAKYLFKINDAFNSGVKAVQTRRVAKNLNSSFAILDACSEGINNHIFRKGANAIGITSALIGSGMAFEFNYLKDKLGKMDVVSGFDKVLQLEICKDGIKVIYMEDALIFDEKIDNHQSFGDQRKRWIFSQFNFLKHYFTGAFNELFKGNFSYFHLAVLTSLILPRALYFIIFPVLILVLAFIGHELLWLSIFLFIAYLMILFISIPHELRNNKLFVSLISLPKAVLVMIQSALSMNKAKKRFIHTGHDKTVITNPLYFSENE